MVKVDNYRYRKLSAQPVYIFWTGFVKGMNHGGHGERATVSQRIPNHSLYWIPAIPSLWELGTIPFLTLSKPPAPTFDYGYLAVNDECRVLVSNRIQQKNEALVFHLKVLNHESNFNHSPLFIGNIYSIWPKRWK